MERLKVAVLISGRGSNLQALIDAARSPSFPAEIALVVSNVPGAAGLQRARKAGIATEIVDHRGFKTRESFEDELHRILAEYGTEFICLAGFMRILTAAFVERWRDRIINIHPSLLPKYKGLDTHSRALQAGEKEAGCTIHFVRPEMDAGPIIFQASVRIHPDDTEDKLAARVLAAEHQSYPRVLKAIAEGRVSVAGENVSIAGDI